MCTAAVLFLQAPRRTIPLHHCVGPLLRTKVWCDQQVQFSQINLMQFNKIRRMFPLGCWFFNVGGHANWRCCCNFTNHVAPIDWILLFWPELQMLVTTHKTRLKWCTVNVMHLHGTLLCVRFDAAVLCCPGVKVRLGAWWWGTSWIVWMWTQSSVCFSTLQICGTTKTGLQHSQGHSRKYMPGPEKLHRHNMIIERWLWYSHPGNGEKNAARDVSV